MYENASIKKKIGFLVLFSLFLTNTFATNYYVDPSSPVAIANGTITNPFKTLTQVNTAILSFLPGDTLFFKRGQSFSGKIIVSTSGTELKPIVYTSYGLGAMPELTNTTSDIIVVNNKQYVVFDRLKLIDKTMSLTDHTITAKISYAIVLNNAPHCTISNCDISLVGVAINTLQGSDFTTIKGNNIYNLRAVRNTVGGNDDYGANAMVVGSSFNQINYNRFEGCWATSYDYGYDGGAIEFFGTTINDNTIMYNTAVNCDGFIEIGSSTYGVSTNNLIAYNKIINCGQTACLHNTTGTFGIKTDNLKFFNNVIIETKKPFEQFSSMFWFADPTKIDVIFLRNNIFYITTTANVMSNNLDTLKLVHSNNIFKLSGGVLGFRLATTSEMLPSNEQIFLASSGEPETWDYRLLPGSIAINRGVNVGLTSDFVGNPIIGNPDAGIFEYLSIIPVPLQTKYYVDPSSLSTLADGSFSSPWKTIAQVNAGTGSLQPGDTVFFKRSQVYTGSLIVGSSGTKEKPIVYTSYGLGDMPEFTNATTDVISISNKRNIVLNRLRVIDKTMSLTDHSIPAKIAYGIVINNSPNCSIINCEITMVGVGIFTRTGSDSTTIYGNNIFNLRAIKNTVGGLDDYGANAIVLGSSYNQITNNRVEGCWANSYDFGFSGGAFQLYNSRIDNNTFLYNSVINSKGFIEVGGESNGTAINTTIGYNKIINCGQTATFHNKVGLGSYINTTNTRIFNNVIIETKTQFSPATAMFWFADPTIVDVAIMRNNIIWLTTGENVMSNNLDTTKLVHTNNIYKLRGGSLGIKLNSTELSVGSAQFFVDTTGDPETWDYRILPGSVAVDFGVDVGFSKDFIGTAISGRPDAGIYESLFPAPVKLPAKYYVDPSATSTIANGSFANPWKTIAQVNAGTTAMIAGDSVFFKRGQIFSGSLAGGGNGTELNPIVYTSYGTGNSPILTHTSSGVISIINRQYIVFDGFKIIDQTMSVTDHNVPSKISYGIVLENAPYCTIRNFDISLVGVGIATREGSDFTTIDNNNIYNLRAVKNTIGGTDDYGANAMVIGTSSNQITNNKFDGCWANSYDFTFSGGAIQFFNTNVSNNRILYNTATNSKGFLEVGGTGTGLAVNNLIAYNKIINCGQTATFHNKVDGSFIKTNNTRIFNNVIVENKIQFTPASAMFWYADPTIIDVVIMRNNIIWLTTGENVVNASLDTNNLVHTNNIYKLRAGVLGFYIDPTELMVGNGNGQVFMDTTGIAENWNYRPMLGSPAVNFGVDVLLTRDFINNPIVGKPDAGIYENQSITPLPELTASIIAGQINCNGEKTSVTVTATGGVPPYVGTGSFTVAAGTYSYIVSDAIGGKDTVSLTITQPLKLNMNLKAGVAHFPTDTTNIKASATGGVSPYMYQLNAGAFQSVEIFNGLTAGNYTVTVKDNLSCLNTQSITITALPFQYPVALAQATSIKCFGGTAVVTVSASGGTAPYTGTGSFTVSAGTYNYIVTDAIGLKDTASITLTEPTTLGLSLSAKDVNSLLDTTTIFATAIGGTKPYSYQLNTGSFQYNAYFSGIPAGSYTVTVKDWNACLVTQPIQVAITPTNPPNRKFYIIIFPNPSTSNFILNVYKYNSKMGPIKIQVFDANGLLVHSATGIQSTNYTFGSSFAPGKYTVVVQIGDGVQAQIVIKM